MRDVTRHPLLVAHIPGGRAAPVSPTETSRGRCRSTSTRLADGAAAVLADETTAPAVAGIVPGCWSHTTRTLQRQAQHSSLPALGVLIDAGPRLDHEAVRLAPKTRLPLVRLAPDANVPAHVTADLPVIILEMPRPVRATPAGTDRERGAGRADRAVRDVALGDVHVRSEQNDTGRLRLHCHISAASAVEARSDVLEPPAGSSVTIRLQAGWLLISVTAPGRAPLAQPATHVAVEQVWGPHTVIRDAIPVSDLIGRLTLHRVDHGLAQHLV